MNLPEVGTTGKIKSQIKNSSICIVEDDRATAKVFARWIERWEAKVIWCSNFQEFKQHLEGNGGWIFHPESAPRVVISDLVLPDGDGTEVMALWRKQFPQNPVIIVTAFASVDNAVESMRKGAFDFLRKPLQHEELLIVLQRAIEHSEILLENESLSSAVRVLSMAQTLSGIADKEQLLKTLGRLLQREFETDECFVFFYHASRKHLECYLDFRGPGLARRAPETVAAQYLYELIEKRPAPPENFSDIDLKTNASPQRYEFDENNAQVIELSSSTGNCAYLVFMKQQKASNSEKQKQFYPVMVQAQRTFQNLDLAAALSFVDELTGLYNQRFLDVALNNEIARAHRYNSPVTVLFIDMDKFKSVNDTYGHIVGSALLKVASKLLKTCMRDADQLLRYGGDEFVAILPNTNQAGALIVAERIRASFAETFFNLAEETKIKSATALHVTTSIGLASYPEASTDARELVQMADNAMYDSKRSGKNRVTCADPKKPEHLMNHRDGILEKKNGGS